MYLRSRNFFITFKIVIALFWLFNRSLFAQTSDIRLNQIGFYPNCTKVAIVKGTPSGTTFYVRSLDLSTIYFTGTLSTAATWSFSNESVIAADFSAFGTPGQYRVDVPGIGNSYAFSIALKIHHKVGKAALKAFYHNRSSSATTAPFAGIWARALGHPDNAVQIHSSAASGPRPTGTIVSSTKGWYDAGDYNSYIVNSGISTYTLLSAYENFKPYYDTLNSVIPESGNALPDILDEIKWNLDWMLTMQDPNDGGIYNKKTCLGFDGFIMPAASTCTRYLVAKGTAAAFDFAAVMAVAYRLYKPFDLTYANQCLAAAQSAYAWGVANPTVYFTNPAGVSTGEYGDGNVTDEREWAATELYIATLNDTYYASSFKNANFYGIPSWPGVRTLGLLSLIVNRKNLTALGFADTTNMKAKLIATATTYSNHWATGSAYKVAMGAGGNGNFVWGSNGEAANIGMILMAAYRISANTNHYNAALSNMDYLLGRNATTYCFVGGFGTNSVLTPHHRPSQADGVAAPVPGWLAGGPNTDAPGDCGAGYPSTTLKALCYQDALCSYSTNEIAINWNAPFVFLASALENLLPCGAAPLPVKFLSFTASKEESKTKLVWEVAEQQTSNRFIIQKSTDGKNFLDIGFVKSDNSTAYFFYDEKPSSINYYRLKEIDQDETITLSPVIVVEHENLKIKVYPNPATSSLTIESLATILTLQISSTNGVVYYNGENLVGKQKHQISLEGLSSGLYIIRVLTNDDTIIEKLIVN